LVVPTTEKVYGVPLLRPETVTGEEELVPVSPLGFDVAV
jgi:hypothetical protein